ncbi:PKD domain-containing protein [Poriferisphaera sp. WC338]|uniref:PKD domain-containing protein n=1 Tax=Poriferisphaera sp. WC338 TaxID=3425129 RepID=UPI003D8131F4
MNKQKQKLHFSVLLLLSFSLFVPCVSASTLNMNVGEVTSSTVTLGWEAVANASEVRIYLASEPSLVAGANLPGQVLIDTLPGDRTTYKVGHLAAEVDVFLRVEVDSPSGLASANTYARTIGGPNSGTNGRESEIDTPLRSIHGYAPNVLQLVLAEFNVDCTTSESATSNDGPVWQKGTWTIMRADGSVINVTDVHRQTTPVGAWNYSLGYSAPYSARIIDMDHHIWLVLDENIGNQEILTINGPKGIQFILPFSDKYLESTAIQVNQIGYNPRATERWAYVSGWMGDGGGLDLSNFPSSANVLIQPVNDMDQRSIAASSLSITQRSAYDTDSGGSVDQIDLSSVAASEGTRYRVQIPGVGVSWATAVSEEAAFKAYYTITRGLYYQRWGDDLDANYTEWVRGTSHHTRNGLASLGENPQSTYPSLYESNIPLPSSSPHFFPENTPRNTPITLTGGHHDASDYDIRPYHTVVPQLLMRAYELNPTHFTDGQLTIPESSNGVPDLLDEAIWNIAGWEGLQEPNGGVRAGVESFRHPLGLYHADDDDLPYWTFAIDVNTTARAAGLFAQAARLIEPFDAAKASELETRAINAYNYASANSAATDFLLYGASELYALTNQAIYKTNFENHWNTLDRWGNGAYDAMRMRQNTDYLNGSSMPDYTVGYLTAPSANTSYINIAKNSLDAAADDAIDILQAAHGHRNSRPDGHGVSWGGGTSMGRYMDPVYSRLQLGDLTAEEEQKYFNAMSMSADYVMGCNPMGMSWIVGLGSRYPRQSTHADSQSFVKENLGLMPGIPVYGPVNGLPGSTDAIFPLHALYPGDDHLPDYRRYADTWTIIPCSEFTVWESSAPHVQLFAALLGVNQSPPNSYLPNNTEHRNSLTAFTNKRPVVEAGNEQVVTRSGSNVSVTLNGSYTDDGATPSGGITTTWSLGSGPASVSFTNSSALSTSVTFTRGGEYVLHLAVDDGDKTSFDFVKVIVLDSESGTPSVDANSDTHITAPVYSAALDGTVTGASTTLWNVASSPSGGIVTFANASATDTTVTFNIPGVYVLRLAADSGTLYSASTILINVHPEGFLSWSQANVADANTIALYHFDETSGTVADNAQGSSNRDISMQNAGVWQNQNAWGGSGGHVDTSDYGGSINNATLPLDWSDGMTLSFWMLASEKGTSEVHPVRLQGSSSWANETFISWRYDWFLTSVSTHDRTISLKDLGLIDPTRTLTFEEVTDGKWHHYALVYTGDATGRGRLYVDNKLQEINTAGDTEWDASGGSLQATGRLIISAFGGKIDELLLQADAITDFSHGHDSSKNWAPWVNAGEDQYLMGEHETATLKAWVTDDGYTGSLSTTWTVQSGPGIVTFGNINNVNTTADFSTSGSYTLRLTADDGVLTTYDEITIAVLANQAPSVSAGADQVVLSTSTADLNGSVIDDGLPGPPAILTYSWSKVSGPGTVYFANSSAEDTTATFSSTGVYVLRLTANDGNLQDDDDVILTVHNAPSVDAGPDQTINLPFAVNLDGTVSDDGLPNPPASTTVTWSKESGPGTVTFGDANATDTTATFGAAGTYVLRLNASDGAAQTQDTITVIVKTPGTSLYQTDFETDVSSDWTMSNASISTTNGWMAVASGWGTIGYAYPSGSEAIHEVDVRISGHFTVGNGNANGFAEIACRTTGTGTDGIRLQLMGSGNVNLYDGNTLLDSISGTGIEARFNPSIYFELTADDTGITGKIIQNAGNDGNGHSWNSVTINLSGTASTYVSEGNVRFRGRSYNEQPKLLDINIETLTIINQAPVAVADSYSTDENTQLVVPAIGVLSNDTDANGDPLTAILVSDVSNGSLSLLSNGGFTYTPSTGYIGQDSFTYKANDTAEDSNVVTVTITVNEVNQAPTVNAGSDVVLTLPQDQTNLDGTVNDDNLPNPPSSVTVTWSAQSGPGVVTFGDANATDTTATFTAPGEYILRLTADDSELQSYDEVKVTVNLTGSGGYSTVFDTDVSSDFNEADIGLLGDTSGSHLTVDWTGGDVDVSSRYNKIYTVVLNTSDDGDGTDDNDDGWYTGDVDASLEFQFDNSDSSNVRAIVSVRQNANTGVNTYPLYYVLMSDDTLSIRKRTGYSSETVLATQSFTTVGGSNDYILQLSATDSSGSVNLSASLNQDATSIATLNATDSSNPLTAGYIGWGLGDGPNGNGTFRGARITEFSVNDGATSNTAPVTVADSYNTNENVQLVVPASGVLSNDTDSDGDSLSAIKVTDPTNGSVTLNSDGSFTYTPNTGYIGQDSFTYKANDGTQDGNTATVDITVNSVSSGDYDTAFTTDVSSDFNEASIGLLGETPGSHLTVDWTGGDVDVSARYNKIYTAVLNTSDDGDGTDDNDDGWYTGDVDASLKFQFDNSDSSNVRAVVSVRQNANTGANTYPLYYVLMSDDTLSIRKRTGYSTETVLATQSFSTQGGTNTYTLWLNAIDNGGNVDLAASLKQDGTSIATLNATDSSSPLTAGYIGWGLGDGPNGNGTFRGGALVGFTVNE